ncbi:ABC-type transport system [Longilinea arvoryzae]|uniref:ABC-type transport system n=1 Tax=Longilinea arvoryzae TaxID=360412 RepID=A0A0S7BLW3_9CHLR|nr:ABC transporter permease [Longilinea arvoryzae]GAP15667.1 ABC-type transport system [Longilinea arvoryzae]
MRPRTRKILSDFAGNRARSIMVVASIAVGLIAVGMILVLMVAMPDDMKEGYAAVNPANIQIEGVSFDPDFIDHLGRLPQIRQAEGVAIKTLRIQTGSNQSKPIKILAARDFSKRSINQVKLVEGTWPPKEREIVLEVNRADETPYKIGDEVRIQLSSGDIREAKLVGIVQDQTLGADRGGAGFFLAPIQGYVTLDTLPLFRLPEQLTTLQLTTVDGSDLKAIEVAANTVLEDCRRNGVPTISKAVRLSTEHPNLLYVNAMTAILFLLGLLVIFLSAFLIINTLSALLNQQIEQIGIFKSYGATRGQIIFMYLGLVLLFSAFGFLIAIPLTNAVAFRELDGLAPQLNYISRGFRWVPQAVLGQALIALIVPQAAALIPILHGSNLTVQQALSGSESDEVKNPVRRPAWVKRLHLSRPISISLRNVFRKRLRLILTLITLALGGAMFVATFNMRASIENYIERLGHYFMADVNLSFSQPYDLTEIEQIARESPDVASIEGWAASIGQMVTADDQPGETILMQGPPEDSALLEPILVRGRWLNPQDANAIVLNEVFMDLYPDVQVGDTIKIKIGGQEIRWQVVGFFQFAGKNTGLVAFTNYSPLAKATHTWNQSTDFRIVARRSGLTLDEQNDLAAKLETAFTDRGYQVSEARAGKSILKNSATGLNALTGFLLFLAILMAVVGTIGLSGTMSLNVMERTREIGVMRAIGASDFEIQRMVIVEGMLVGLLSWVASLAAAIPVSNGLASAIGEAIFGSPIPVTYTLTGISLWLGLMVIFTILASLMPARTASRLTIRQILAYE